MLDDDPAPAPSTPAVKSPQHPTFKTNKELRTWAYGQHKRAAELEAKVAELEKVKAVVAGIDPKSQQEREALAKKADDLQKRIDEYENRIRLTNYESSDEYRTKYLAPYQGAVSDANDVIKELVVSEENPETGEANDRPATWEDFQRLYELPLGHQAKEAKRMFGDGPNIVVMQHIASIKAAVKSATKAREEYATKAGEIEKSRMAEEAQKRERAAATNREVVEMWSKVNQALSENPNGQLFWGKDKDDQAANEALAKGFAIADKRFGPEYQKLSVPERVKLDAMIRHRVAGFSKLNYLLQKTNSELAEARKTIESLKASGPGRPASGGAAPAGDDKSPMDKFSELANE
jgi:hypothetical protein